MRRLRRIKAAAEASPQTASGDEKLALLAANGFKGVTQAELAALAREQGFKGVPETWKRETLIEKLTGA